MTTLTTSIDVLDLSDGTVTRSQEGQRTITTTDAAELPLLTLDPVYGECVQDGTPAPDAPVKILSVKSPNLLPMTFTSWPKVSETGFDVQVEPSGYGATIIENTRPDGTVELDGHTLTKTIRSFYQVDQGNDGGNLRFRFDGAPQRGIRSVTVGGYFKVSGDHASGDILFRIRNASYATIDEYKKAIPKNTWTFVHKTFVFTSDRAIADILLFARTTGNGSSSSYCTVETAGLFLGLNSAEINAYIPRNHIAVVCSNGNTAYIDMTDKETGDPVELYGFDDAHRDILRVDSTGHVTVEKKVHKLYFDGSDMAGWSVLGNYVSTGGGLWQYTVGDKAYTENADVMDTALCAISDRAVSKGYGVSQDQTGEFYIMKTGLGGNTLRFRPLDNGGVAQTVAQLQTWLQTHPTTILWQDPAYDYTIDLGYVDLPVVEDESVVHIAAEVQPVIGGTWWTHAGKQAGLAHQKALLYSREGLASYESLMSTFGTVTSISGGTVTVSADDGFELQDGKTLFVHANGYTMNYVGAVSINVNGTGAQPLYVDSANAVSSSDRVLWGKDALMLLRYAQEKWTIADAPNRIYAYSTTAGSTAAKALTLGKGDKSSASGYDYVIIRNTTLSCRFTNANTAASATLNLEGGGAINITAGGSALDGLYNWYGEDTVEFVFTGTQWAMMGNSASRIVTDYGTSMFVHPKGNMSQGVRIGTYDSQTGIQIIYNSVLRTYLGTDIYLFGNASGGSPSSVTYPYTHISSSGMEFYTDSNTHMDIDSSSLKLWADGSTRTEIRTDGIYNYYVADKYTAMKSDGFYAYYSSTYYSKMIASGYYVYAGDATYPVFSAGYENSSSFVRVGKSNGLNLYFDNVKASFNNNGNTYGRIATLTEYIPVFNPSEEGGSYSGTVSVYSLAMDFSPYIDGTVSSAFSRISGSGRLTAAKSQALSMQTYYGSDSGASTYLNMRSEEKLAVIMLGASSLGYSTPDYTFNESNHYGPFLKMMHKDMSSYIGPFPNAFEFAWLGENVMSSSGTLQGQSGVAVENVNGGAKARMYATNVSNTIQSQVLCTGSSLSFYGSLIDISHPSAWRTALGLNVVTTKPTITAASGITIYSRYFERQGNVVCFMISFYYSSAISVPASGNIANIQVATVATGYRPVHEIGLQSHGDDAGQAWGRFDTNGVIYLGAFEGTGSARTVTLSSTNRVTFYGTYMAA